MHPRTRKEFEIAIICALPHEADAVIASFDVQYDKYSQVYDKLEGDKNTYTNGRIGQHNVVLCLLPRMGKVNAASATASLLMTYTKIQLALVVGICGAVPVYSDDKVIFLGDVIISDSVIEYDFGSQYPNGFQPKSHIKETAGRHTREIRSLLTLIRTDQEREEFQRKISHHVRSLPRTRWSCPGQTHDMSESSNDHHHIHIGTIASADTVMKSEEHRDKLAKAGVIGFEMEGAGVWDNIPCIIIKGVCDYADSRKNDIWQNYAAAVGASGAKAFLEYLAPNVKQGQ
jgi:nucleoside phosphorylase